VNENNPGSISIFKWNTDKTKLITTHKLPSQGIHPCYISLNKTETLLTVANYSSGNIFVHSIVDGVLNQQPQTRQHTGNSIVKPNQNTPHAHCSKFTKDGHFLYVSDLGIDKIVGYPVDKNNRLGKKFTGLKMDAGDGPRHFTYHPTKNIMYIVNEFSNSITVAKIDSNTGTLTKIDKQSTLPQNFLGNSFAADIHISKNGKFLYASNRGHNSIAIFSIAENGMIQCIRTKPVRGDWPRNFAITPDENYLFVANQKSDNITVFKIDKNTGLLTYTGTNFKISKPVCLSF
jgi:6-phosphogluconolactonase